MDSQIWWRQDPGAVLDLTPTAAVEYHGMVRQLEQGTVITARNYYWYLYEEVKTLIKNTDSTAEDEAYERGLINRMELEDVVALCRHLWVMRYHQRKVLEKIGVID